MKILTKILFLLFVQSILLAEEPKLPNLIGSWFLNQNTQVFIADSQNDNCAFWSKTDTGIEIKFLNEEMAIIYHKEKDEVRCFYDIYIDEEKKYSFKSYKVIFTMKDGNEIILYLKNNGTNYSYIWIANLSSYPYKLEGYEFNIAQGEMISYNE